MSSDALVVGSQGRLDIWLSDRYGGVTVALDLSAAESISAKLAINEGTAKTLSPVTADPDQVTNPGHCWYDLAADDVDAPGYAEIQVIPVFGGKPVKTYIGRLTVEKSL